jgi:hypothetical protein
MTFSALPDFNLYWMNLLIFKEIVFWLLNFHLILRFIKKRVKLNAHWSQNGNPPWNWVQELQNIKWMYLLRLEAKFSWTSKWKLQDNQIESVLICEKANEGSFLPHDWQFCQHYRNWLTAVPLCCSCICSSRGVSGSGTRTMGWIAHSSGHRPRLLPQLLKQPIQLLHQGEYVW